MFVDSISNAFLVWKLFYIDLYFTEVFSLGFSRQNVSSDSDSGPMLHKKIDITWTFNVKVWDHVIIKAGECQTNVSVIHILVLRFDKPS